MNKIYDEFNDFNFTAIENILKKYKDIIDISEINEAIENFYEFDFDKVFKILEKCNPSLSTTKAFNQAKDFNFLELTKILSALEKKLIKEVDGDKTKENLIKKFILKIMKKANLIT